MDPLFLRNGSNACFGTRMRFLLTVICLIIPLSVFSYPISRQQAMQKAQKFLQTRSGSSELSSVTNSMKLAPAFPSKSASGVQYYAFNRGENQGYVLVAADDRIESVLGYTDEGEFDYQSIPDNMREWLDGYAEYIAYLQTTNMATPMMAVTHAPIAPMLTTNWDQGAPYNNECPNYFSYGRSVTGCVATAMAQVMYYQRSKSVTEVQADIPGYTASTTHATYGNLKVEGIAAGSPIDWDNMLGSYNSGSTAKQQLAVAQLMHYCGVSVEMDYTNSQSAAFSYKVADAMKAYFGYGESVRYVQHYSYSDSEWDALLYNELDQGRVVYLSGSNSKAGHAFVTDGHDGSRCFHINWGWGGQSNGYFLLSVLNPGSQGIGGSGDGYSQGQEAIIGCEPENYGDKEVPIANATVKRICLENFDADGDGVFTYSEAAAVKDIGTVFKGQRFASFVELYYFTSLTALADSAFYGCTLLKDIKLPKGLKSIGAHAFNGCRALAGLKMPVALTSMGMGAFAGCRLLSEITLPMGMTAISDSTFAGCAALTDIELPLNVMSIGSRAFEGCKKLGSFKVKTFTPQDLAMGEAVFENVDLSDATLNVKEGLRSYFESADQWSAFGKIYEERTLSGGKFADLVTNKDLYLYNVGADRYMNMGEAWGTQAVLSEKPMRFSLRRNTSMPEGVYYLYSVDTGKDGHILFRTSNDDNVGKGVAACFVDGADSHISDKSAWWTVKEVGKQVYTFQVPSGVSGYSADKYLGIQLDHNSNVASPTYGAYSDVDYSAGQFNCQWRFVLYDKDKTEFFEAVSKLGDLIALAKKKYMNPAFEEAVYDNMECTLEEVLWAQHTLRKKMNLIEFKDPLLRETAITNFDTDGDGELSYAEANKVTDFGYYMFSEIAFTDLTDLKYFANCPSIYGSSFYDCKTLKCITLPEKLENIYYYAFRYCTALEEITIPYGVRFIGGAAFGGCTSLGGVTLMNPNPSFIELDEGVFDGLDLSKITLYVPAGSKDLYAQAEVWKDFGNIVEVRGKTEVGYAPIEENVDGYILNVGEQRYMTKGEAWGTQAIVGNTGFVYQFRRTASLPDGVYYLYSGEAGGNNVLFRTSTDSKVGTGVKACFVDGSLGASAHWQTVQNTEDMTFTMQVPQDDASYVEGEYLGTDYNHASDASPYGTYGAYWDINAGEHPQNVQWAFIRKADIEAAEAFDNLAATLKSLLDLAVERDIEHEAEQAVYDNFGSTAEEIEEAIASLRKKFGYIDFADDRVKTLCVNNWDFDNDGEISYDEAAAVTDLGNTFYRISDIKSFEELRYFTSLASIGEETFYGASSLVSIYLPESVKSVGKNAFSNCSSLGYMAVLAPDAVVTNEKSGISYKVTVFVPASLVGGYEADSNWGSCTIKEYTGVPTVTVDDVARQYGRTISKYSYTISGAPVNGVPECTLEEYTDEATGETFDEAKMPVGKYELRAGAGTITSPSLKLVNGTLTIDPAELTVTAKSYSRGLGEENPEFTMTYKGLKNREKAEEAFTLMPTIECDATAASPGGEYEIRVSGGVAPNYSVTYVNGVLTVVDPTGITNVESDPQAQEYFDLQGRRITTPTSRGIYIVNGQKVVK